MYQRYTSRYGGMQSGGNKWWARIRTALMLALTVAVIVLAVLGGRAMNFRKEAHTSFVRSIQTECADALSLTTALSRTAGASSSATLGRIRSHVYAMDNLNQISAGLGEGYLVPNEVFTNLYDIMDAYANQLTTGMTTGDQQTALTDALNELVVTTAALE